MVSGHYVKLNLIKRVILTEYLVVTLEWTMTQLTLLCATGACRQIPTAHRLWCVCVQLISLYTLWDVMNYESHQRLPQQTLSSSSRTSSYQRSNSPTLAGFSPVGHRLRPSDHMPRLMAPLHWFLSSCSAALTNFTWNRT